MIETVLAVLVITSLFLCLFELSHMLTGKILVEHAAMRVARARSIGFNDFMCRKAANVSVIPVAGRRLWPGGGELDYSMELSRVPIYMGTPNAAVARGVLEYEGWHRLWVTPGDGTDSQVTMSFELFDGAVDFELDGEARLEENYKLFMNDQGK